MVFPLKKKIVYPLFFFVFFWFTAFPLFADEDKEKDKESDREVVLRVGQWEFDFEGQVRLRGISLRTKISRISLLLQDITRLSSSKGHAYRLRLKIMPWIWKHLFRSGGMEDGVGWIDVLLTISIKAILNGGRYWVPLSA